MSKIAIISDIHSNAIALRAILKNIERKGIDDIYCLGDSVPKYADPKAVIDIIKSECKVVLKGNGEQNVVSNPNYTYTWNQIGIDGIDYLDNLPLSYDIYISGKLFRFFHASPYGLEYVYNPNFSNENTPYKDKTHASAKSLFDNTELIGKKDSVITPDAVVFGHTHLPLLQNLNDGKLILNPGSVGEPNIITANNEFLIGNEISYLEIEGDLNSKTPGSIKTRFVMIPYADLLREVRTSVINSKMATAEDLTSKIDQSLEHMGRGK